MRIVYRCHLKTHPTPSQVLSEVVSTSTLERDHEKHRSVSTFSSHTSSLNGRPAMCAEDSNVWRLDWSSTQTSRTSWIFGLPFATGTIQFETLDNQNNESELTEEFETIVEKVAHSPPTVRVKVVLPPWLSYKTLNIITWKSQIGWKQYLRVNNIFPASGPRDRRVTPFTRAMRAIVFGSLNQLRSQFENREVTPWDEDSEGYTLLLVGSV